MRSHLMSMNIAASFITEEARTHCIPFNDSTNSRMHPKHLALTNLSSAVKPVQNSKTWKDGILISKLQV
jgi:hypothetical protein